MNSEYSLSFTRGHPMCSTFTQNTAKAEELLARRKFEAIVSSREYFLSLFFRILAGTFTCPAAQITVESKNITYFGNTYLLNDLLTSIEELRKIYNNVFAQKRNITTIAIPTNPKYGDRCVLREYGHGSIAISEAQEKELPFFLQVFFEEHVVPCIKECSRLLHLCYKVASVKQKIYWDETSEVRELKGYLIEWNKIRPFVYEIKPCSVPERAALKDVLVEYFKSNILCDVTLIGNDGGIVKTNCVVLFLFANKGVQEKLVHGQRTFKYSHDSAKFLHDQVKTVYQQVDDEFHKVFYAAYEMQKFCDFLFISKEGVEIKLHKIIIHVYGGEAFRTALTGQMAESVQGSIRFPEVSQNALRRFVDYLYLGQESLIPENVLEAVRFPVRDDRNIFKLIADVFSSVPDSFEQQQTRQQQLKIDIESELCELIDLGRQWMVPGLVDCCTNILSVMPQPNAELIRQLSDMYEDNQHLASISQRLNNLKV